jgi:hypothetical protein
LCVRRPLEVNGKGIRLGGAAYKETHCVHTTSIIYQLQFFVVRCLIFCVGNVSRPVSVLLTFRRAYCHHLQGGGQAYVVSQLRRSRYTKVAVFFDTDRYRGLFTKKSYRRYEIIRLKSKNCLLIYALTLGTPGQIGSHFLLMCSVLIPDKERKNFNVFIRAAD